MKRTHAVLLASLLLWVHPVHAGRTYTPLAPEFPADAVWINAKPLTLKQVRLRRVVLVAFFSTTNINSLRALSALKAWNERYELNGLLIVGVHVPEFSFQRDPLLLRSELKRLGVRFPVFMDNDRNYWRALNCEGWPSLFLIDYKTHLIFDHLGESGYSDFEGEIRDAINTAGFVLPENGVLYPDPKVQDCGDMTPNMSLGMRRGKTMSITKAPGRDALMTSIRDGETAYAGKWDIEQEDLVLSQPNADKKALLRLIYRGSHSFAVFTPPSGKTALIYVRQDQMWMHSGDAGKDVQFDDDGRSFVMVRQPRLFNLSQNPDDRLHEMTVIPDQAGTAIYGLSFSDRCLSKDLP